MATNEDGVYRRKDRDGYWIQWVGSDGRRHVRKAKSIYLAGARRERADLMRSRHRDIRFGDVADQYLDYQKPRLTGAAYAREKGIVALHLKPYFQGNLGDITKALVSQYVNERLTSVSSGSARKELNVLKHLFRLSVEEWGYLNVNPTQGVKPPKNPAERVRYLQPGELAAVISACPEWLRPIALLAAFTGLRRSELIGQVERNSQTGKAVMDETGRPKVVGGLRWLDVNLEQGVLLLPQTKNGDGRVVYLNRIAREALASLPFTTETRPTDKLFPDVNPAQITVEFIRACKKAGIPEFHFHDLRHTCASWMRQRGVGLDVIAKQLGHHDLRMTMRYAHLADQQVRNAVLGLDDISGVFEATRYPTATKQIPGGEEKKLSLLN
jgi:integrase